MSTSSMDRVATDAVADAADEWARFQAAQRSALSALVAGDPGPFQRLWARTPEVSLLGAFGGIARGWEQVCDRLAAVAAVYRNGVYQRLDHLDEQVHGDTAFTVHVEEIRSRAPAGEPEVRERRVTKVYRRDGTGWRILHMHSDPLVTAAFPGRRDEGSVR